MAPKSLKEQRLEENLERLEIIAVRAEVLRQRWDFRAEEDMALAIDPPRTVRDVLAHADRIRRVLDEMHEALAASERPIQARRRLDFDGYEKAS